MKQFLLYVSLFFIISFSLQAQPVYDPENEEPAPVVGEEILVTASGIPESAGSTPAATTIIDRQDIERGAARDVADLLREVPGLIVSRTGSSGKATSVFTRGGNSTHTLVLWNGIEINSPYFSGYNWGQLSTVGVERIEIVRGPYSALYGSEAVSGVVNILTTPDEDGFSSDIQAGGNGLFNGTLIGSKASERWSANVAYEHRQDDGFAPNDDFAHDSILGGFTFSPSERWSVSLLSRFLSYELGTPRNVNAEGTAFVPTPDRREDGEEVQWSLPFRLELHGVQYEVRLSRNERRDNFSDPQDPFFRTTATTNAETSRAQFSASSKTRLGTFIGGAEYEEATVDDASSYGPNLQSEKRNSRSAFLEDRLSLPLSGRATLELSAGARFDEFDTFGSEVSPRVAAAWVSGGDKVRAAYGRAFRAPSIGELYFPFFGNPELQPERSTSIEVGYDRHFARDGSLSVTLFRSDYDNLIVYDNVIDRFGNVGASTATGVELGVASRIVTHVQGAASYTWLDTEQNETGEALLRRPKHSGSLSFGYDRAKLGAQLLIVHNGERADVTDLIPFGRVSNSAYTTADLTVQYALGELSPYLKLENLTDETYEEVFGYPSSARRLTLGVRYSFRPRAASPSSPSSQQAKARLE